MQICMSMKRSAELVPNKTSKRGSISIAEKYPEYIKEWSEENTFKPEDIPIGSNRKIKWVCACGNKWETRVYRRKNGCPVCFRKQNIQSQSVSRLYPDLVKEWHEDNTCRPEDVSYGSHQKIKWTCELNHTWIAMVRSRSFQKRGCPYCFDLKNSWTMERIRATSEINDTTGCWIWPKDVYRYHVLFKRKTWFIYKLSLFLSKSQQSTLEKPHVAHTCGNRQCVNPDHLRLATAVENARDKDKHGTQLIGQNNPRSKLSDIQAQEIRESSEKTGVLVEKYGVTRHTIIAIRSGKGRIQNIHVKYERRKHAHIERIKRISSITPDDYKTSLIRAELKSIELDPIPNDTSVVLMTKCKMYKYNRRPDGYTQINVKGKEMLLHILSVMCHHNACQPIPKNMVVRHLCKNKSCFNHEHLKIGTMRENALDAVRAGSKARKLSDEQIKHIYLQKGQITATSLAKHYNISPTAVSDIWKKRTWSHVTNKLD